MTAPPIDIDAEIKPDVRALIPRDDRAGRLLLENLLPGFRRLPDPFDRMYEPGVRRIIYVTHEGDAKRFPEIEYSCDTVFYYVPCGWIFRYYSLRGSTDSML